MIEALKNTYFKKIWEDVNWKVRHPKAKSLEEALEIELQFYGCHLVNNDATMSIGIICGWNDVGYKYITTEGIDEKKQSMVIHIKDKICQKSLILGRPITLEDIFYLFSINERNYGIGIGVQRNNFLNPKNICEIRLPHTIELSEWQLTKPLHEQGENTWKNIYEIINE